MDTDRLEHEVALLADKLDISEEIIRFRTHLKEMDKILEGHNHLSASLQNLKTNALALEPLMDNNKILEPIVLPYKKSEPKRIYIVIFFSLSNTDILPSFNPISK